MANDRAERRFYHHNESWYSKTSLMLGDGVVDQVMLSFDGGEFAVRWHKHGDGLAPRLECYDDAFALLAECQDVIGVLRDHDCGSGRELTPKSFCAALIGLGFEDVTDRKDPYDDARMLPSDPSFALKKAMEIVGGADGWREFKASLLRKEIANALDEAREIAINEARGVLLMTPEEKVPCKEASRRISFLKKER